MGNRYFKQKIKKGTQFNGWTIIKEVKSLDDRKFLCKNPDGLNKIIRLCHLKSGASKGLSKKELSKTHTKHGMKGTRFYNIWQGMKRRCYKEYEPAYKNYGGRGISVCKKWLDFQGFCEDMFDTYSDNLTIERINNDGNYCKENCMWIRQSEQGRNQRTNLYFSYKNKRMLLVDWAKHTGINYHTLYGRLFAYNMSFEKAIKGVAYKGNKYGKLGKVL